jgi:hypothetical protein
MYEYVVSGNRARKKKKSSQKSVYPEQTYLMERKVFITALAIYPPATNEQTAPRKPEFSLKCKMP